MYKLETLETVEEYINFLKSRITEPPARLPIHKPPFPRKGRKTKGTRGSWYIKTLKPVEKQFKSLLEDLKIDFVQKYKFHPTRHFRFDFAIIDKKIGFEIDDSYYENNPKYCDKEINKRQTIYCNNCIKQLLAAELGWRIIEIPEKWMDYEKDVNRKKEKRHLIYPEDLKEIIKEITA